MADNKFLRELPVTRLRVGIVQIGLILAALYVVAKFNYLLFHVLAEFFGAAISLAIFLLAWNARKFAKSNYYLFFGTAFLVSGTISLIHALTYRGMGVVAGTVNDSNVATQLWLANQYVLAATFVIAPFLLGKKIRSQSIILGYLAAFTFLLITIFYWKVFPAAYVEGTGLTPFKKISEYAVAFSFLLSLYFFWKRRNFVEKRFFQLVFFTLTLFFVSTISFTLYIGVYSFPNEFGHLLRVLAFYVSYLALVELGLMRPYHSIFKDLKDKESELKSAVEEWSMTFNSISDPIFILDTNHTIVKANKALLEFLGKNEDEVIGKKCYELVHKQHQPWITCPLVVTKKTGRSHTEEVVDPKLGKALLVTTSPIFNSEGEITGIAHAAKDITERKEAERKMADLAKFPQENPNPVMRISREGKLIYANPAADVLLKAFRFGVGDPVPAAWKKEIQKTARTGDKRYFEIRHGNRFLSVLITPVAGTDYFNLYAMDITELKEMDKAKDDFISLASHQLRTPLTSIGLSAELLLRGIGGKVPLEQKEYLGEIYKSVKKMTLLANNLLNVSRVDMGSFEVRPETLDISSLIEEMLKDFLPLFNEKKLRLETDVEKGIIIESFDMNSIGIILQNLLSNAVRYTPAKGAISIKLKKEKNGVLLTVSDTGIGIPAEYEKRIFEKSFRAENAKAESSEGAGLGLYMAKIAADRGGARMRFESKEGKGTTFFVSFPG